jgi:hypothetical protein
MKIVCKLKQKVVENVLSIVTVIPPFGTTSIPLTRVIMAKEILYSALFIHLF